MRNGKNLFLAVLILFTTGLFSQVTVSGTVVDDLGSLLGASVLEKGTENGVSTEADGTFSFKTKSNSGSLEFSYVGYETKVVVFSKTGNLGKIQLKSDANTLGTVVVVGKGVIDLVKERETPVAVSTIKAKEIQEKAGNQEFPEILKSTPSVYTSKESGGYGDSKISLRGFDNKNIAIIINGQPVNDMESGKVYWSNWSGLQDVASAIQIQRGLGASKLAVPSVGGTINVVTKSAEKKQGGSVNYLAGNNNYFKSTVAYNTGLTKTGWSASVLFAKWQGDGYIDGTQGEGNSYFLAIGHKMNEKHSFNFSLVGSSQWHNKRATRLTIADQLHFGKKYNADWGYRNGNVESFAVNYYNKPISSLNWDYKINDKLSLSSVVYASWGRGGGSARRGNDKAIFGRDYVNNNLELRDKETGLILFDKIVENNKSLIYNGTNRHFIGKAVGARKNATDANGNTISESVIRGANMNSHDWYGGISNLKYKTGNWTFGTGLDLRTYKGYHYFGIGDLMGLDAYYSTGDQNSPGKFVNQTIEAKPFKDTGLKSSKIHFYNVGLVDWVGTNGIIEYSDKENLSGVIQVGVSNKSYQRADYFDQVNNELSKKKNMLGGYLKGGLNFNIDEKNNIFANAGIIKRQPGFRSVFKGYTNDLAESVNNESIESYELGYGYKSSFFNANLNLYRSSWKDRSLSKSITLFKPDGTTQRGTAFIPNLEQIHQGVELEFRIKPIQKLKINGSVSYGDWTYARNVTSTIFDRNRVELERKTIYINNVKVGNSAQFTGSLGADYTIIGNLKVDMGWNYAGNLYADFNALDKIFQEEGKSAVKLPDYNLFDAGISYKHNFTDKYALSFRLNVNNVLDTEYISRSSTNIHPEEGSVTDKGIDVRNRAWYGFGRTWNTSIKFNF